MNLLLLYRVLLNVINLIFFLDKYFIFRLILLLIKHIKFIVNSFFKSLFFILIIIYPSNNNKSFFINIKAFFSSIIKFFLFFFLFLALNLYLQRKDISPPTIKDLLKYSSFI